MIRKTKEEHKQTYSNLTPDERRDIASDLRKQLEALTELEKEECDADVLELVTELAADGRPFTAVREYRLHTGCSIIEAVHFVDSL
jgi:hypothetical protein